MGSGVGGILGGGSAAGNAGRPSVLRPSQGSTGPLSPGGRGGSGVPGGPFPTPNHSSGSSSPFGAETGLGRSFPGLPGGVPRSVGSSPGDNGPFSRGGTGERGVGGGPFSAPSPSNGPATPVGIETGRGNSFPGLPGAVSGSATSSPLGNIEPLSPGGTGGTGVAGGPLSTPILPSGPASPFGSESAPGSSRSSLPDSTSGPGTPGLPIGVGPGTSASSGPTGAIGSPGGISIGHGARRPLGREGERAGPRLRAGGLLGRRTTPHRHRAGKLSPQSAAAIGLGVAGSALAFGALAAGIVSAVQQHQRGAKLGGTRTGCVGCQSTPCVGNCGRKRRSLAISKVPSEILDGIPVNFERLY